MHPVIPLSLCLGLAQWPPRRPNVGPLLKSAWSKPNVEAHRRASASALQASLQARQLPGSRSSQQGLPRKLYQQIPIRSRPGASSPWRLCAGSAPVTPRLMPGPTSASRSAGPAGLGERGLAALQRIEILQQALLGPPHIGPIEQRCSQLQRAGHSPQLKSLAGSLLPMPPQTSPTMLFVPGRCETLASTRRRSASSSWSPLLSRSRRQWRFQPYRRCPADPYGPHRVCRPRCGLQHTRCSGRRTQQIETGAAAAPRGSSAAAAARVGRKAELDAGWVGTVFQVGDRVLPNQGAARRR